MLATSSLPQAPPLAVVVADEISADNLSVSSKFLEDIEIPDNLSCALGDIDLGGTVCAHTCSYLRVKLPALALLSCILSILLTSPLVSAPPFLALEIPPRVCPVSVLLLPLSP